jgi:hypothetical protein
MMSGSRRRPFRKSFPSMTTVFTDLAAAAASRILPLRPWAERAGVRWATSVRKMAPHPGASGARELSDAPPRPSVRNPASLADRLFLHFRAGIAAKSSSPHRGGGLALCLACGTRAALLMRRAMME